MTCVAGIVRAGQVWIGADSAASTDDLVSIRAPKLFRLGGLLVGFAGSYRAAQILQYGVELPEASTPALEWLATAFVDVLRTAHRRGGAMRLDAGLDGNTIELLVGYRGGLFEVDGDYAVAEVHDYAAVGSGAPLAIGALAATPKILNPVNRLERALDVAERHCPSVRGPFSIVKL